MAKGLSSQRALRLTVERKSSRLLVVALVLSLVAALAIVVLGARLPTGPGRPSGVHVALDSARVGGEPGMNTSTIWTARITSVTNNESLDRYKARLVVNDTLVAGPVTIEPGLLATVGEVMFDFFETGVSCSPTPCPPPDGPDGLLGVDDYFRLSNTSPSTSYTIEVVWAANGETVGTITIMT